MIITKETDYAMRILRVLLDGEKHSGNYLTGGAHVARNGFMGNLEDVCFL